MNSVLEARAANSAAIRHRAEIEMAAINVTPELIRNVVQTFYERVLAHPQLGPIFAARLAGRWPEHIERMVSFWTSIAFKTGAYGGKPVQAHSGIDSMTPELFPQWLELFATTLAETVPNEEARAWFMRTADRIARSLSLSLFYNPALDDPMSRKSG